MGIEVENGKVKVSGSYSLKIPGAVNYSSEDAYVGLSVEFDSEGDATALLTASRPLEADLVREAKLAVFAQLDVDFVEDDDGILRPKLKAATPAPAAKAAPKPSGGGGGGQGTFAPPKASKERVATLPKFVADFGNGPNLYRDQRPLKEDNTYAATAPDFKNVEDPNDVVWLYFKDGGVNQDTEAALVAAGQEV